MSTLTLLVADAVADIGRMPVADLAVRAGLDPAEVDVPVGGLLNAVREAVCEEVHGDDTLPAAVIIEVVECALGDAEVGDAAEAALYPTLLRLACSLADLVGEAREDECRACRGTGECWFDVETASGRVVEDMVPCNCGA